METSLKYRGQACAAELEAKINLKSKQNKTYQKRRKEIGKDFVSVLDFTLNKHKMFLFVIVNLIL